MACTLTGRADALLHVLARDTGHLDRSSARIAAARRSTRHAARSCFHTLTIAHDAMNPETRPARVFDWLSNAIRSRRARWGPPR